MSARRRQRGGARPVRPLRRSAAATVLLAIAGCASGPGAPMPVPPAAAVARTAVPTPLDAVAFVTAWLDALGTSLATRDGDVLRALSTDDCRSCQNLAATADGLRERRVVRTGPALRLVSADAPPVEGDTATVDVVVDLLAQRDSDERTGAHVLTTEAASGVRWLAVLERHGASWRLADLRSTP